MRAGPGFYSRGERRLLRELRDGLDIIWAALRTLRIGPDRSIGSLDPRAMGPGSDYSRGAGCITPSVICGEIGISIATDRRLQFLKSQFWSGREIPILRSEDVRNQMRRICSARGPFAENERSNSILWPFSNIVLSTLVVLLITTGPSSG